MALMIRFHWSAVNASVAGMAVTIFTGAVFFKADAKLLAIESSKGLWNALIIISIILTALMMYQTSNEAGTFSIIRNGMKKMLPNELLLVLALGWAFESFLQGITGFGVPVAVGAPLLIGIGVKPIWAVIIPLMGQSWGNTYGTLAAAWDALALSAGLSAGSHEYWRTAFWAAFFIMLWNAVIGFSICWFYGKGKALKKGLPVVLIMVLIQGGGELLMSRINTTLACFLPSCLALIVIFMFGKIKGYGEEWSINESRIMSRQRTEAKYCCAGSNMILLQAFAPYLILSVLALAILIVEPIRSFLEGFSFGIAFPETQTGYGYINEASERYMPFKPFTHASMFLIISAFMSIIYYRRQGWIVNGGVKRILLGAVAMAVPPGLAVASLAVMARIMSSTGQTAVLANGISTVLGKAYVVLAPMTGLIGTLITGSNMSSNLLFGEFQMTAANLLNVDTAVILGAQTAGGSIGSSVSPSNIILGATTANITGKEGVIMKNIFGITVPAALAIGILAYGLTAK